MRSRCEVEVKTARVTSIVGRPAWAVVLCLAFGMGCVIAHAKAPDPKAEPTTKPAQASKPKLQPDAKSKGEPQAKSKDKRKASLREKIKTSKKAKSGCGGKKGGRKGELAKNPNTKWACDQTTVTLDPVWKGKPLVFNFNIRNEGTANLHIRAKGG
ncbi:MAG: hypothetical protein KAV00_05870 [Phycisphaerae bacterium]|nr:hypothetical protein [Phycisphaerae bacterium]